MDSPVNAFVVADKAKKVGEYERQLTSTLFLCQITELTTGRYECAVNWNRGDNITKVWSAYVLPSSTSTNGLPAQTGASCCADFGRKQTVCCDLIFKTMIQRNIIVSLQLLCVYSYGFSLRNET